MIHVTKRDQSVISMAGHVGRLTIEVMRDNGLDELLAICGGNRSCATCHVYVDALFADLLPPMSDAESDLLDGSDHRTERSRLSCQIPCEPALEGLRVSIAPED